MKTFGKVIRGIVAAGIVAGLAGCPSPLLSSIKSAIARATFTATSYNFLRQWGNPYPQYSFYSMLAVKSDIAGNVYVADSSFRIRKYTPSGALQTVYNLKSNSLAGTIYDMALDPTGNMYVANSVPQVQEYDVNGNFIRQWGSTSNFADPYGITVDSNFNVYVVDAAKHNVQKFDSTGNPLANFGSLTGYGTFGELTGITTDGTHLYISDAGNSEIVVMDGSGNYITSWGGSTKYGSPALAMLAPWGIAYSAGTLYVADNGNSRVLSFDTGGDLLTYWGSNGTGNGQFMDVNSVAVDAAGSIYAADSYALINNMGRIEKFAPGASSSTPPTYLTSWVEVSLGGGNGVFAQPEGVAFDSSGNVYVADTLNNRIEKFGPSGNFLLQWGTLGSGNGQFAGCFGVAIDSSGRVYVADSGNSRVQEFDSSGNFLKIIGSGIIGVPYGVAVDSSQNVYVTDINKYEVEVFNSTGFLVRSWGSQGTGQGQFEEPIGLAIDPNGNVWVSDVFNNNVQKFGPQGNFLKALGGSPGNGNGQFILPVGVAVDQVVGAVYVVDLGNKRIQKFDPSGNFVTAWGGSGTPDGFGYPYLAAINSSGQVIVSDYINSLVIEFAPAQ